MCGRPFLTEPEGPARRAGGDFHRAGRTSGGREGSDSPKCPNPCPSSRCVTPARAGLSQLRAQSTASGGPGGPSASHLEPFSREGVTVGRSAPSQLVYPPLLLSRKPTAEGPCPRGRKAQAEAGGGDLATRQLPRASGSDFPALTARCLAELWLLDTGEDSSKGF